MSTRFTSPIWKCCVEEFESVVKNSKTRREILLYFGLSPESGNYVTLRRRLERDKIDITHLVTVSYPRNDSRLLETPIEDVLVIDSKFNRSSLKRKILKYKLIPYKCACGNDGNWLGKKLALQLDHVNGISNDNRLENLRFICPNCHSQTETFCGRHKRRKLKVYKQKEKTVEKIVSRKFEISKERLEYLITTMPMTKIAEMLGVSDNAVKKRANSLGIKIPPMRGYWRKIETGKIL